MKPQHLQASAAAAILVALLQAACIAGSTKPVTVEMKWRPAAVQGPWRGSLYFEKGQITCSLDIHTEASQKYIESFGSAPVPVVFDVVFAKGGKPVTAELVRLGEWDADRLGPNERLLGIGHTTRSLKPGQSERMTINVPGDCFDPVTSTLEKTYFSAAIFAPFLLSFFNLGLLALAFFNRKREAGDAPHLRPRLAAPSASLPLWLAAGSQVLYLLMATLWLYRLIRFSPGSALVGWMVFTGLVLSVSAFLTALRTRGLPCWAAIFVAFTTAWLWQLAALATIAV